MVSQSKMDKKREIRLFISSTFLDMQEEREYLIKKIFPELRALCRERGIEFTEVDLRWGITGEDADEGKTLRICLEEIDRCKPFFIGVLGTRYGWVPEYSDVAKDSILMRSFPFVNQAVLEKRSITEMEIIYGALENKAMDKHAFFYFKSLNQSYIPDSRLDQLKKKILSSGYPVRQNYANLEELGRWVKDDLERVINQLYPTKETVSSLEAERRMHDSFAASRYRGYIENPDYLGVLDSFANRGGVPVVITGPSGCGKSALLSNWSKSFRERNPDTFIVCHYIGAYGLDSSNASLLRRIMAEIKERYKLEDEIPSSPSQIEADFPLWLNKVTGEKLILAIDAINQLENNIASFEWLPVHFPKNIHLIISSTDGIALDTMMKRSWSIVRIRPINLEERKRMIDSFLQGYSKKLSTEQRNAVACCDKCSNPLFLRTVLEEIRVFGLYDRLDERINYYIASKSIDDLFQRLLQRMEQDYGKELICKAMKLIGCSRKGLSETELVEVGGFGRLELSKLLIAFDYNLMSRGGLITFFHTYLRNAVEQRYLCCERDRVETHNNIASYFERYPFCERVIDELPWQYKISGQHQKLEFFISNIDVFIALIDGKRTNELLGYWLWLKDRYNAVKSYRRGLAEYEKRGNSEKDLIRVMNELARFYQYMTKDYDEAEILYQRCIDMSISSFGENSLDTARYMNNLGTLFRESKRDFEKAVTLCKASMGIREKLAPNSEDMADNLNNLAAMQVERGNFSNEVESLYKRALSIYKKIHGEEHELIANAMRNMGIYYFMNNKYDYAEALWYQALSMDERLLGANHIKVSGDLFCLVRLLSEIKGDYVNAEKLCKRALKIDEDTYGIDHPNSIQARSLLADILYELGNYSDSEEMHRRNLTIYKNWNLTYDEELEVNSLAVILWKQKKYDEAETAYRYAIELGERKYGVTTSNNNITRQNLAVVLRDKGLLKDAEDMLLNLLDFWKKSKNNDYYTALCMYHLGILYFKKGELNKAESMYIGALKLWEAIKVVTTSHYALCLFELAKIYTRKENLKGSRALLQTAFEIHTKLKGPSHPDSCIIRDALGEI